MSNIYKYAEWAASGRGGEPDGLPDYSKPLLKKAQTLLLGGTILVALHVFVWLVWTGFRLMFFWPFIKGDLFVFALYLLWELLYVPLEPLRELWYRLALFHLWAWLPTPKHHFTYFCQTHIRGIVRRALLPSLMSTGTFFTIGLILLVVDSSSFQSLDARTGGMLVSAGTVFATVLIQQQRANKYEQALQQEQTQDQTRGPKLSSQADVQHHLNRIHNSREKE